MHEQTIIMTKREILIIQNCVNIIAIYTGHRFMWEATKVIEKDSRLKERLVQSGQ
jgi:hypothetical protein